MDVGRRGELLLRLSRGGVFKREGCPASAEDRANNVALGELIQLGLADYDEGSGTITISNDGKIFVETKIRTDQAGSDKWITRFVPSDALPPMSDELRSLEADAAEEFNENIRKIVEEQRRKSEEGLAYSKSDFQLISRYRASKKPDAYIIIIWVGTILVLILAIYLLRRVEL